MILNHDWKRIVKRAWSVRLMALAAMLSGAEVALPLVGDSVFPVGVLAILSALATGGAFVARIVAQRDMTE